MTSTHLKAKVVAYTQSTDDTIKDANELIAYIARVSNPDNQHNNLTAPKLIDYLMRNKHWSPFEHFSLTIEIECPKDIAIQILRHRSFKFQEFSQRYADVTQIGFTARECRLQDTKNRQNSIEMDNDNWSDKGLATVWRGMQVELLELAQKNYEAALVMGIAKEQARCLLPIGLTVSRLYMTGDIRSWLHYLAVRLDPTTQKEHRELAALIKECIGEYFNLEGMFEVTP